MPIPSTAFVWGYAMDPSDVVDFTFDVAGLLEAGEAVASYTLTLGAESVALGLVIGTGPYAPVLVSGTEYRIWLSVNSTFQSNVAFDGAGSSLPIVLQVITDSAPARTRERTLVVKVAQQ